MGLLFLIFIFLWQLTLGSPGVKPDSDNQIIYEEDISKLEEIIASDKANIKKFAVQNAEEKEK